jgi:AcrR family transcriptional regulator
MHSGLQNCANYAIASIGALRSPLSALFSAAAGHHLTETWHLADGRPRRSDRRATDVSTDPPRGGTQRKAERRAELLAAAVTAVRRSGASVSVAEIAATAGITKPVIYRYFTDRAGLRQAMGQVAARALVARISAQAQRDLAPAEQVRRMIGTFLNCLDEDPELWRFVIHHPADRSAGRHPGAEIVADAREQIARMLTALLGERLEDPTGAEVWAHGLVGMVQSTADWRLEHRTMSRAALTDHLTDLAWGGIAELVTPSPRPPHDERIS